MENNGKRRAWLQAVSFGASFVRAAKDLHSPPLGDEKLSFESVSRLLLRPRAELTSVLNEQEMEAKFVQKVRSRFDKKMPSCADLTLSLTWGSLRDCWAAQKGLRQREEPPEEEGQRGGRLSLRFGPKRSCFVRRAQNKHVKARVQTGSQKAQCLGAAPDSPLRKGGAQQNNERHKKETTTSNNKRKENNYNWRTSK